MEQFPKNTLASLTQLRSIKAIFCGSALNCMIQNAVSNTQDNCKIF